MLFLLLLLDQYLRFLNRNRNKQIKQKDIEDFFHISNPTVTGILNRLEQKGYIERISCDEDKRVKYIVETEKAESLHKIIYQQIQKLEKQMVSSLEKDEQEQLFILLDQVYQNLLKEEKKRKKKEKAIH